MIELELSGEAFEEVRDKCIAAGLIAAEPWDEDSKPFTVGSITFKQWKYVPTPEEIARQEEYRKTPLGQWMERTIELAIQRMLESPNPFLENIDHPSNHLLGVDSGPKIGTTLRIRLPADFVVSNGPSFGTSTTASIHSPSDQLPKDYFVTIGDEWLDK